MSTSAAMYAAFPEPSEAAQRHHAAMLAFMREEVLPAEPVYERQREEAGPDDGTVPPVVEELKAKARERGLWNLFLPSESGLTQLEYATIAELIRAGASSSRPRPSTAPRPTPATWSCSTCSAPSEQQEQWLRAAAGRRDPLGLRDDRAGRRVVRRHQHRDPHRARRRRVRHQRPQVVDLRRRRPALPGAHRDGQDRPGRRHPPAAVDGDRADRHPRRRRSCRDLPGLRPLRPARPLRDRASTTSGCR